MQNFTPGFILSIVLVSGCSSGDNSQTATDREPVIVDGMALIPGGLLNMGGDNDQASDNEFPKHKVEVDSFWMDRTEVTNRQFEEFVKATGYVTVAERPVVWEELAKDLPPGTQPPPDSVLQPGALVFKATSGSVSLDDVSQWWRWVVGANWRHPEGPGSDIAKKMDHPVVQISWEDANAYAHWKGCRLPTEAEWEWAARGGLANNIYPWGNEPVEEGAPKANFWQGMFPYDNKLSDGFYTTAPVGSFPPNGFGLFDMAGNVWEWCSDWFDVSFYKSEQACYSNTKGAAAPNNPSMPYLKEKILRGGSFLCNDDYCSGYRNARRMGSSPDTGLNHVGFRCVKDL